VTPRRNTPARDSAESQKFAVDTCLATTLTGCGYTENVIGSGISASSSIAGSSLSQVNATV
jgi:hypothetical protein